jgi:peptide/nickel transport system substrate-binding protein
LTEGNKIQEGLMADISRRNVLELIGLGATSTALFDRATVAFAADADEVRIGWPSDVPTWDPVERTVPDAQPIFKLVFDQPLDQAPDLKFVPRLATAWEQSTDGKTLTLDFRDDVTFHDGSKMTSEDFRYTFFERVKAGHKIDLAAIWGRVTDIETPYPTRAVMRFSQPFPTAVPWLAFLASYVVPKAYMEKVGIDGFRSKPIGTGPYKLIEYQLNSRIVLERNDAYFGQKPAIKRVVIDVIADSSARVAAIESSSVDLTISIPVREVERLGSLQGLAAELNPITRIIMLYVRGDLGFKDKNVRLACHYAIDKEALSKAFYHGAAKPLSVLATPGTPGYVEDFKFPYDPEKAKALLAASGHSADNPAKIQFGTHNGQFAGDYDMARAIAQMWKKVGIEPELVVIDYAKFFELNRAAKLPEAMLYSWDNSTGDPEIYIGYVLNPQLPFSAWKEKELGDEALALFVEPDTGKRIAAYKTLNVRAVEEGAVVPILQSVQTLARKKNLAYTKYENGWVLADTMKWT